MGNICEGKRVQEKTDTVRPEAQQWLTKLGLVKG